jgi:hypothetical protein
MARRRADVILEAKNAPNKKMQQTWIHLVIDQRRKGISISYGEQDNTGRVKTLQNRNEDADLPKDGNECSI